MTVIGDQPRVKFLRNIAGNDLTIGTVDINNVIMQVNSSVKVTIDPINTNIDSNVGINGNTSILSANGLNFLNAGNTKFIRLQTPPLSVNSTYNLPATGPSVSGQFLSSDTSGNMTWQNGSGVPYPSVAANDSDVVFVTADTPQQLGCFPTLPRTYTLPATVVSAGQPWVFFNRSTTDGNTITINASGGSTIDFVIPTQKLVLIPLVINPTTPADWVVQEAESGEIGYTPVITGFGAITNINFTYRRLRNNIFIKGNFFSGIPTASPGILTLPSTLLMGNVPAPTRGMATANVGSPFPNIYLVISSGTQFSFSPFNDPYNATFPANSLVNTGDFVNVIEVSAQIIGWH